MAVIRKHLREWSLYYKEPWIPPHASPDAQYRASKLKAYLYTRVLDRLCAEMKDYAPASLRPSPSLLRSDSFPDQHAVANCQPAIRS